MKIKQLSAIAMGALLLLTLIPAIAVTARPAAQEQNLLANPSFEGFQNWYDVSGLGQVPNGWKMDWLAPGTPHPDTGNGVARTETRVLRTIDLPEHERTLYVLDGLQCMKIFAVDKLPLYVALSQQVDNLEVGRRYRFEVPIFVDTFVWDEVNFEKDLPPDLWTSRVGLGAGPASGSWSDTGSIVFGGPWSGESIYLRYNVYAMEFVATEPQMRLYIYLSSKWGGVTTGFFLDNLKLTPLGMDATPTNTPPPPPPTITPGPSPTPLPPPTPRPDGSIVHVVQSGDTVWSIAIQYASSLGITPEEMKVQIERLNTIGQFLYVGQELVISVPSGLQPQPTAPPTAVPTAASGEGEPPAEPLAAPGEGEAPETLPVAPGTSETGSVCVSAYHDRNMDGMRDAATEELLPNVEFKLSGTEGIVDAYTSDGVSEPHCFELLPSGTYMIEARASAGYNSTTPDALAVPLLPNTTVNIEFGHQRGEGESAVVENPPASEGSAAAPAEEQSADEEEKGKSDGLFSKLGNVIIGVSGIFVLLLAGAVGIAFIASRQR